jgi:hypothetical protein
MTDRTRRLALTGLTACALCLGGWLGLHHAPGLSATRKDQADVRVDPTEVFDQQSQCIPGTAHISIPLRNYGPGPVTVSSVVLEAPSGQSGTTQQLSTTIAPGRTAMVNLTMALKTADCEASSATDCGPTKEQVFEATFTVTPTSGRARPVRLPIGARLGYLAALYQYPWAQLFGWDVSSDC